MKTLVSNIRVPVAELASVIYAYGQYLKANFSRSDLATDGEPDSAGGDFRLQVRPGYGWTTHEGDSQYDQDHRGHWGACSVPYGCTRAESLSLARDLIGEAQESVAMSE